MAQIGEDLKIKTSHYIISAVGLVTALSWNTSIKEYIQKNYPMPKDNVKANFIYAVIATIILVLLIYLLPDTKSELPVQTQNKLETLNLERKKAEIINLIDII